MVWYIREVIKRLMYVADNIGQLADTMLSFKEHITEMSELELFYGDETIVNLVKHTNFLVKEIDKFNDIYSLSDHDQEELEDDEPSKEEEAAKEQGQ